MNLKSAGKLLLGIQYENRKWYHIIGWWEIRRLPYNILMMIIGYSSFYIAYISIPLIYLFIGLGLNALYTGGWLFEILVSRNINNQALKNRLPMQLYFLYVAFSTVVVLGYAISMIV